MDSSLEVAAHRIIFSMISTAFACILSRIEVKALRFLDRVKLVFLPGASSASGRLYSSTTQQQQQSQSQSPSHTPSRGAATAAAAVSSNGDVGNEESSTATLAAAATAVGNVDPMLAVYHGPFEWERVISRRGAVPEPRSGHTMNVIPTVCSMSLFDGDDEMTATPTSSSMTTTANSAANVMEGNGRSTPPPLQRQQQRENSTSGGMATSATGGGGLLVLFGNDRTRMLPNAAVFDVDDGAWCIVNQFGTSVPARSGHSLTAIAEFYSSNETNNNNSNSSDAATTSTSRNQQQHNHNQRVS